jgi:hypothetical protein
LEQISGLTFDDLTHLAANVGCVALVLGGDLDSSNVRAKSYIAWLAQQFNERSGDAGIILVVDVCCGVHILHRIIETGFETGKLIANLHATPCVCFYTDASETMLRVAKDIVLEDLQNGGRCNVRPRGMLQTKPATISD